MLARIGFDTAENEPSKVCPIEPSRSGPAVFPRGPSGLAELRGRCENAELAYKVMGPYSDENTTTAPTDSAQPGKL